MSEPMSSTVPTEPATRPYSPSWLSWSVWTIAAIFYLAGFYLRVSPAVITTELMRDFSITAGQLGGLSAAFFYAYVLMQVPTGVLVDSWGARKLLIAGALGAAAGTALFGVAGNLAVATIGRALMGGATAVAWIITLKLASHWFPQRRFAMLTGLGLLVGNIGALFAQVPLRLLVDAFGWRGVTFGSAAVVGLVAILAGTLVRNDPVEKGYRSYAHDAIQNHAKTTIWQLLRGFPSVFGYRNTWLIFLAQGGFVGSILSFTGLWGPPFLEVRFHVTPTTAAAVCSVMIVCWAIASPICGYLSDKFGHRKPIYLTGAAIMAVGWVVMFYVPLSLEAFVIVAAITSLACGAVILGFAYGKESVPVRFLGTISGAINVGNMIGPTLLQPAIGAVLDRQWTGGLSNGLRVYGVPAFQTAFLLVIGWSILTVLLIAFTKETNCVQRT